MSDASSPPSGLPTLARSPDDAAEKPAALPAPDLTPSSPATDAAPSATSKRRLRERQQNQLPQARQGKARRRWSPELHRRFVDALQRLGGAQGATPKKIRKLMKVEELTIDEVKSHLQKYRLHTRRASSSDGGDLQAEAEAETGLLPEAEQQASRHSTSPSGSPQGALQLTTVSSRAMSATAGDSCDGDEAQQGTKASSS